MSLCLCLSLFLCLCVSLCLSESLILLSLSISPPPLPIPCSHLDTCCLHSDLDIWGPQRGPLAKMQRRASGPWEQHVPRPGQLREMVEAGACQNGQRDGADRQGLVPEPQMPPWRCWVGDTLETCVALKFVGVTLTRTLEVWSAKPGVTFGEQDPQILVLETQSVCVGGETASPGSQEGGSQGVRGDGGVVTRGGLRLGAGRGCSWQCTFFYKVWQLENPQIPAHHNHHSICCKHVLSAYCVPGHVLGTGTQW